MVRFSPETQRVRFVKNVPSLLPGAGQHCNSILKIPLELVQNTGQVRMYVLYLYNILNKLGG